MSKTTLVSTIGVEATADDVLVGNIVSLAV